MRRFLRAFLNWLDRKFPDKVIVTAADYLTFKAQIETASALLKTQAEEIAALKIQIANINMAVGFSVPKVGVLER